MAFLFQMLFLATFFPTWEGGAGVYDFVGVSVKPNHSNTQCFHFHFFFSFLAVFVDIDFKLVSNGGVLVFQEFMKATVDLADLLGLHLVMSRNAGKGEYKIMVAAMGWATAELVMSRYVVTISSVGFI